MHNTLK